MPSKKIPAIHWLILVVALFCMFATKFIPAPEGLPQAGFQVLGILVGAILLFITWGTSWPSMMVIFALMTVDGLSAAKVTQATFGNNTVVFLLFCMMLAACLTKSGAARHIAIWFLTNPLAVKSPWWTVAMYFTANYILNFVLSTAATIFVMMPIAIEIFESVGLKKEDRPPIAVAVLLGTLITGLLSNSANPISHAVTIQGFSYYESYTGEAMDFFTYCAIAFPISIVCSLLLFCLFRFVWNPDVSALKAVDYVALKQSSGEITKKERWSVILYCICVVFWMLPGITKYVCPSIAPVVGRINNCLPPLAALFIMNFVKIDGEKMLDWSDAVKAVSWPTFLFIACIMGLGSFMGNADLGISKWLSGVLAPLFVNVSPFMFLLIMVFIINIITNFTSNSVSHSVMFAVAVPLAMTVYSGRISTFLVATLITCGANNGWSTPPSSPTSAVVYSSGWVDTKSMVTWGAIATIMCAFVETLLGTLLARAIL